MLYSLSQLRYMRPWSLNILAEGVGFKRIAVSRDAEEDLWVEHPSEDGKIIAMFPLRDYCNDYFASAELRKQAIKYNATLFLDSMSWVVNGTEMVEVWKDDEILKLLDASPKDIVLASILTMQVDGGEISGFQ